MSEPSVSIIVPVFNQWAATERCLRSLAVSALSARHSAEIILSDDGSTDETGRAWMRFERGPWKLRYRQNPENLGFLKNANAGAGAARGRYLCFLNNDVVVPAGWLDRLVDTLESDPTIGAVGSMFLDPQDRILECGAVVHSDGSARQLGQNATVSDRRYQFVNDVDFVSAACLLVRAEDFQRHGGFDEHYAPCYYEDADFCLKLALDGLRVVVDPRVQVVHYEGTSHGSDTTAGLKRYQEINRAKLFARWRERLVSHHPSAEGDVYDRMRIWRRKPAIVVHFHRTPTWDQDAGSHRIRALLGELVRRGHHAVLVCPGEPNPYLAELQGLGVETLQAWWGGDADCRRMIEAYRPLAAVFLHHESEQRFAKSYYTFSPATVRVLDTVDLAFLREIRESWLESGRGGQPSISTTSLPPDAVAETISIARSDVTFVVSDFERQLLTERLFFDEHRVKIVTSVHEPATTVRPFHEREGFVFLGGFRHRPNIDAVLWIVEEIWPRIRASLTNASLLLYGSSMPREILSLSDPSRGVFARGFVADHREALGLARVMLTPLRFGAGVKGKIGEALAVGTPVVSTAIGAEGMDEAGTALAIGNGSAELAEWATRLYRDEDEWSVRSARGFDVLRTRFSVAANVDTMLGAMAEAQQRRRQPSRWDLTAGMLWHAAGCPGEPQDLTRALSNEVRKREAQAALVDQYRAVLARLRERESRLQQDLALSTAARQRLVERLP